MLKLRYSLALAGAIMAAVFLSAPYASAQQAKKNSVSIAVIDVQLILNTSLAMKNVREQLEVQRKRFQVSIAAEEGKLRAAGQKLARQRGVLSPQALARPVPDHRLVMIACHAEAVVERVRRDHPHRHRQQRRIARVVKVRDVVLDRRQTPYVKPELMITTETLTRLNKRLPVLQLKLPEKPRPKPPSVILGPGLKKQK